MDRTDHLCWVLINDELHQVKEYSNLQPKQRPTAICPVCRQQVTMRLGRIRIFHAAHQPDSVCSVTQPESALHLNTKIHIYKQLQKRNILLVYSRCSGSNHYSCGDQKIVTYISGWDHVEMEYSIDQFRPDIVLIKDNIPIGAVEVFVTHSLEPEKENYLKDMSIPWVEVDARSEKKSFNVYDWEISQPIKYKKINSSVIEKWNCDSCKRRIKKEQWRLYEEEVITEFHTSAFRIIDFYYVTGKKYRGVFFARKRVKEGNIVELAIVENYKPIFRIKVKNLEEDKKYLTKKFDDYLRGKIKRKHIVDCHMPWQEVWNEQLFEKSHTNSLLELFPQRYIWSKDKQKWVQNAYFEIKWNVYFEDNVMYGSILRNCSIKAEAKL